MFKCNNNIIKKCLTIALYQYRVQQFWRDHNVVTDEMAAWLKKQAGCRPYEGLMDVPASRHVALFNEDLPNDMVACMKVDRRNGTLNVFKKQVFYTGINGRGLWVREDMMV